MRTLTLAVLTASLSILPSCTQQPTALQLAATPAPNPHAVVDELLGADRSFAAAAAGAGGVAPMAAMFAGDAMTMAVPEPGFAIGPGESAARIGKVLGDHAQETISWSPVRAGISADGMQGFTLGYLTVSNGGKEVHQAKYLSYWVKGEAGWRVRLYKLVPRDIAPLPTTNFPPVLPDPAFESGTVVPSAGVSLAAAEKAFSDAAQTAGLREYFQKLGRADSLHTLASNDFLVGNIAIGEAHPEGPSPLRWKADDVVIAPSGDLGATYGYLERNGPTPPGRLARIPFFTVWHRDSPGGEWYYVAE